MRSTDSSVCMQGRNQNVINVITEELNYLTWQEAYVCLTDEQLPKALRAKYCELIIGVKNMQIPFSDAMTYS